MRAVARTEEAISAWSGVEMRHLIALWAVAEEGSFTRGGERLGYTQSAISQQISALEDLLGERLIERRPGPRLASVTRAGEVVLRHALAVLDHLAAARADLRALSASSELRVGTFQTTSARLLPAVLQRIAGLAPALTIHLTESIGDLDLLAAVQSGEIDITFATRPLPEGPFEAENLITERFVVAAAPAIRLPELGNGALPAPFELPLVCLRSCRATDAALAYLESQNVRADVVLRTDDSEIVRRLAATGRAAALAPAFSIPFPDDSLRTVAVGDGDAPSRTIALVWHSDRELSQGAKVLLAVSKHVCRTADAPATADRG
jgi:DNA-binding transcriptional LysR family regulator